MFFANKVDGNWDVPHEILGLNKFKTAVSTEFQDFTKRIWDLAINCHRMLEFKQQKVGFLPSNVGNVSSKCMQMLDSSMKK